MNAPAKGLLKVVSILFIIFGAIATVISLLGVLGSAALTSVGGSLAGSVGAALGGILLLAMILFLIVSVLELILGIIGLKKCGDPAKATYFIVTGIILCVLSLISLVISSVNGDFQVVGLIGFLLPVLYIIGGAINLKAARQ